MNVTKNQWELIHARAKEEEAAVTKQLGHQASLTELVSLRKSKKASTRCAEWAREFAEYQAALVGSLEPLPESGSVIVGRDQELIDLQDVMERPRTAVAMLLARAGEGKSSLVEEFARKSNNGELSSAFGERHYMVLALRLGKLSMMERGRLQSALASILGDLATFEKKAQLALRDPAFRIILFIDEAHMLVTIFGAGTKIGGDVMKDLLDRAPIRVIAATTRREYDSTIAVDEPLAERFKTIELKELPREVVRNIVIAWWKKWAPHLPPIDDDLIDYILSANHTYQPQRAEPRKTIDTLEDLAAYCYRTGEKVTREAIDGVFKKRLGIHIGFKIDADSVYGRLRKRILGQPAALRAWNLMLHATPYRTRTTSNAPIFKALLCGSSATGKCAHVDTLTPTTRGWVRHGDLKRGDFVFDRYGNPVEVLEIFDRPQQECYRVTLADGRSEIFSDEHLFGVYTAKQRSQQNRGIHRNMRVMSVREIIDDGRKFYIPQNGAIQFEEKDLHCPPYVMGALIGDGCCTLNALTISSADEDLVQHVAQLIGSPKPKKQKSSFNWVFELGEPNNGRVNYQTKDVVPEFHGKNAFEKRIPKEYMEGSIEQRFELVRGMMDTDGSIFLRKGRMPNIRYFTVSNALACDLQHVLFTLGIQSSITKRDRLRDRVGVHGAYKKHEISYIVTISLPTKDAHKLFWLPRKKELAVMAHKLYKPKRIHNYGCVAIKSIEYVGTMDCNCILVDSAEHLYQIGWNPLVTHNTESVKVVSSSLYPNENALVTINMPDFSQPKDEPLFRKELGEILRHKPNAVVLFDEFEKAADNIKRSMLNILDEGLVNFTVTNREGRDETTQASLRDAVVIATTNAGSDVFNDDNKFSTVSNDGGDEDETEMTIAAINNLDRLSRSLRENLQQNGFPPELLGRFDQIIPYRALSEKTTLLILKRKLNDMLDDLREMHGITVDMEEPVVWDYAQYGNTANPAGANDVCVYVGYQCAQIHDSDSGGARRLNTELQQNVFDRIIYAKMQHPDCNHFKMKVRGVKEIRKADGTCVYRLNNEVKEGVDVEPIYDEKTD